MKRKRAESEAETRRRIAAAAMDLHGTAGPAFTTLSAVAKRAGVRRGTLYRHFPDEAALFRACSGLWIECNPLPDLSPLERLDDGAAWAQAALSMHYDYYRPNARILGNVLRDVENVPALRPTLTGLTGWLGRLHGLLEAPFASEVQPPPLLAAAIRHACSFATWQDLCQTHDFSDADARRLMVRMILAANT